MCFNFYMWSIQRWFPLQLNWTFLWCLYTHWCVIWVAAIHEWWDNVCFCIPTPRETKKHPKRDYIEQRSTPNSMLTLRYLLQAALDPTFLPMPPLRSLENLAKSSPFHVHCYSFTWSLGSNVLIKVQLNPICLNTSHIFWTVQISTTWAQMNRS